VRIPRERMVGAGIASSLVHEVGHQGAALLELNTTLRNALHARHATRRNDAIAWGLWERWISEIIADLWSTAVEEHDARAATGVVLAPVKGDDARRTERIGGLAPAGEREPFEHLAPGRSRRRHASPRPAGLLRSAVRPGGRDRTSGAARPLRRRPEGWRWPASADP
jgi:hypothetical protein